MEPIFCDNCKSTDLKQQITVDNHAIYECSACRLSKVYPNPTGEELQKLYSGVDRNIAKGAVRGEIKAFNENAEQFLMALNDMRIKPLTTFFPEINSSSSICDAGCGSGIYLAALQHLGFNNLHGIEFNPDSVEIINQNFKFKKVVHGEINRDRLATKMDLITAFDVLEHVPDPSAIFQEMNAMLNDKGYIHIRVPNYGSLWAKIFGKKWLWMIPPFHLNYFNLKSLKNMAERNGFRVVKIRSRRSGYRMAFWFLQLKKLATSDIDSFNTSSYSKKTFAFIRAAEYAFRFAYAPFYFITQIFDADDCLELYAQKVREVDN